MADPARARKIADRIKVVAAEYLERRLKDERLGFVTVTDVRVTGDLQHASIFYTVFGSDEERAASAEAIQDNLGRIRSHVGKALGIRLTPTLEFIADALPESSSQIEDALRKARQRDEELAAQRARAAYAGEPDPYKKPVSDEDDPQEDSVSDENVDSKDDTVDGYAPVPPPDSVRDGGEDAQDAAELGAVAGVDVTDEDEDEKQGTGRTDG